MKATAQYFPVVCLIIMLYKVDLADGIADYANESYWAVFSCHTVCITIF